MIRKAWKVLGLAGILVVFSASAPPDASPTDGCCQPCDGSPCHSYASCDHLTCRATTEPTTCSGSFEDPEEDA